MKKIALLKNELFPGFVKLVVTENIEQELDNPHIPMPFQAETIVEVNNAENIVNKLNYFIDSYKIKNKDFFKFDEVGEKTFSNIMDIIMLASSGYEQKSNKISEKVIKVEVINKDLKVEIQKEVKKEEEKIEEVKLVKDEAVEDNVQDNPFEDSEDSPEVEIETNDNIEVKESVINEEVLVEVKPKTIEMIEAYNLPKFTELSFFKNDEVKAFLISDSKCMFDNEEMTLGEAAKKAYKKIGATGLPNGTSNWLYKGKQLKELKV